ncbi:MAG TPA: glycosyl hydrolase family 8 [Mycobacteriales bacterium]|jgi:endoglucanase|nr:glycosyl hydrolase family 8 [Mycobacteriales bacterium]
MSRLRSGIAVAAALAVLGATTMTGCSGTASGASRDTASVAVARRFLDRYVSASGAVIRRDQGSDTVSEGQGYALLLAYAADDRPLFAKVWGWTRTHLQDPDGLFAYHWQNGAVSSTEPAADADLQIAWALDLAGHRWSIPADTAAARRVAGSIATAEIGYDDQGHPTLAAGPWAVGSNRPVQVEPGYWTFPADAALATLTGDHRWRNLSPADATHLRALSQNGASLPPDWATIGDGADPAPSPAPQDGTPAVSGQDGLRAMVWATCLPATHSLAAKWWKLVAPTAQGGALTRNLNGTPQTSGPSPLSLVAAAATARAAGQMTIMTSLLARADRNARQTPTYYGDAWDALGHILLTTKLIPGCTP